MASMSADDYVSDSDHEYTAADDHVSDKGDDSDYVPDKPYTAPTVDYGGRLNKKAYIDYDKKVATRMYQKHMKYLGITTPVTPAAAGGAVSTTRRDPRTRKVNRDQPKPPA